MSRDLSATEIAALRKDYMLRGLDEADIDPNPIRQFGVWFQEAIESKIVTEPNAMVLSTVTAEGQPSGRFVLLKGFDDAGFVFFTNGESAKARDLAQNSRAALTLGWIEMERQVRIEGSTTPLARSAVDAYFSSRPRGSRLGAWASSQSEVIADREVLMSRLEKVTKQFPDEIPTPPQWAGYLLRPERIEFWQGRTNRLHDRLRYRRQGMDWIIERLAP